MKRNGDRCDNLLESSQEVRSEGNGHYYETSINQEGEKLINLYWVWRRILPSGESWINGNEPIQITQSEWRVFCIEVWNKQDETRETTKEGIMRLIKQWGSEEEVLIPGV